MEKEARQIILVAFYALLVAICLLACCEMARAADGSGAYVVSWEPVAVEDLDGYRVYAKDAASLTSAALAGAVPWTTTTYYSSALTSRAQEIFVTAYDTSGNESVPSESVWTSPQYRAPPFEVLSVRVLEVSRTTQTVTIRCDVLLGLGGKD